MIESFTGSKVSRNETESSCASIGKKLTIICLHNNEEILEHHIWSIKYRYYTNKFKNITVPLEQLSEIKKLYGFIDGKKIVLWLCGGILL